MPIACYYSVLRYVPDTIRDEGVNIGVVVEDRDNGASKKFAEFTRNLTRASKLDFELEKREVERIIRIYFQQLEKELEDVKVTLDRLVENYCGGRIQLTKPRATLTDDVESEVRKLYNKFIIEEPDERERGLSDTSLRKRVRETFERTFRKLKIGDERVVFSSTQKPLIVPGKSAEYPFDVKIQSNGQMDLIRCISFDVDDWLKKLDAAKVLVFDAKDILEGGTQATIISVLHPHVTVHVPKATAYFRVAEAILRGQGIRTYNFKEESEQNSLVSMVSAHLRGG